jgi:hypothetical protein
MFGFLKKLFGGDAETNKAAGVQIEQVPYKVEPPVVENKIETASRQPVKCGCGRSESGLCVGLHRLSEEEWAKHDANPKKAEVTKPAAAKAPAKKAESKKPAARKPTAKKAPTKKKTAK